MSLQLDPALVRAVAERLTPEPIREHWVVIGDRRYPPKQLVHAATGIARSSYNSLQALAALARCGFTTSAIPGPPTASDNSGADPLLLRHAFDLLVAFLADENLTSRVARLETDLDGCDHREADVLAASSGLSAELIQAALVVRQHVGRIDDLIHASVITQLLPLILTDGERIARRPSLASGNDPTRPFDLETDRRIAEIKVSVWKGRDTMRGRALVADLVHLSMADTDRKPELYVVGQLPIRFLATSTVTVQSALGRAAPNLRSRFADRYGHQDIAVCDFTAGPAKRVALRDLTQLLPALAALA